MIKLFSVLDIIELPQFSHIPSVFHLVQKENDKLVTETLYAIGADKNKDLEVFPCRHRRVNGEQVVHYVYSFFERQDDEWLHNPMCTIDNRIDAVKDGDLKAILMQLNYSGTVMQFKDDDKGVVAYMREIIVDTMQDDVATIKSLKAALKNIRDM